MNSEPKSMRIYAISVTVLLLLAGGLSWSFWRKSDSLGAENKRQELLLESLNAEKTRLTASLDSLQIAMSNLRTENETLEGKATASATIIQEKDALIRRLKGQQSKKMKELQLQVEALKKAKTEYETILAVLRAENEQLKAENAELKAENAGLRDDNSQLSSRVDDLAQKLAEQIRKTQSAQFKATAFRVEVERRKEKLTAKARRARNLSISFDLADVPEQFRGSQKLYLVISDENGKPVSAANPTKVTIQAPAGDIPVIAQQTRSVNLDQTQRLAFNYKLEEKMKGGNYVAAVYCEKGLLGASSFRLQ
ncbi:MAG: hypothetical protein H6569_08710 [Lewinellaceae bacterium]|nr:hypothetical protein [Lewinellaceae bacterium]